MVLASCALTALRSRPTNAWKSTSAFSSLVGCSAVLAAFLEFFFGSVVGQAMKARAESRTRHWRMLIFIVEKSIGSSDIIRGVRQAQLHVGSDGVGRFRGTCEADA